MATQRIHFFTAVGLALGLSLSLAGRVGAQTSFGGVTGTVTDQTGAVLPGATVTLVNQATNIEARTVTNEVDLIGKKKLSI